MSGTTTRLEAVETPGWFNRSPTAESIRDNADQILGTKLLEASGLVFGMDAVNRGGKLMKSFSA